MIGRRLARDAARSGTRIKRGVPKISAFVFIEECQEEFVFKVSFKVDRSFSDLRT